ncbi:MAG: hypothetical protein AAGA86_10280 [Bacteroidota bacterium]
MKKTATRLFWLVIALWSIDMANAQDRPQTENLKVKKRTLMERFEPEMILTVEERIKLKEERMAAYERHKTIVDTLSISERRRKTLYRDLVTNPRSERLTKTLAEVEFEEGEAEQ